MPNIKRPQYSDEDLILAYNNGGNLKNMAKQLQITYPTAQAWAKETGIKTKPVGFNAPKLKITGLQCRHAREYLKLTRDTFCADSNISKTALTQFELGKATIRKETERKLLKYFDSLGVTFKDGVFVISE